MMRTLSVMIIIGFLAKGCHSQTGVCGTAALNTKIVGGQDVAPGSWPWQASLQYNGSHFCGGSLITSEYVLTAAHCFPSGRASPGLTVSLGRQTQDLNNPNEVSLTVSTVIVHPSYSAVIGDNDIALLKLTSTVTFTQYITPVCLAAAGSTFNNGTLTWVTGWGYIASNVSLPSPGTLREVQIPIVGNRKCKCLYEVAKITDNMMCAGLLAGGKDSCQGDSGGPLVLKQGSQWIQAGIVSFGIGCALANYPGVYSRVSQYQTWINQQITSNQPGFVTYTSSGTDGDLSVSCSGLPVTTSALLNSTTAASSAKPTSESTAVMFSANGTGTPTVQTNSTATITTVVTTVSTATTTTIAPTNSTVTTTTTVQTNTMTNTTVLTTTASSVVCGSAKLNNITGGGNSLASAGVWPWMASVQRNGTHVCGGTLVAEQFVLSSADCFSSSSNASDWTVILGRLKQNGSNANKVSINVTKISFSNITANNVAVLQLSSKPTLSDYIQPICVDQGDQNFSINTQCWAAGWGSGGGAEQTLQQFNTNVLDCGNASSSNTSICTGVMPLEQSNIGGPLMCKIGQSWVQAAVLTLVTNSNNKTRASQDVQIFSKTSVFASFLQKTVGFFPPKVNIISTTSVPATSRATESSSFLSVTSFLLLSLYALI